jgi:ABC-type sugar transport system substrate-binding protein
MKYNCLLVFIFIAWQTSAEKLHVSFLVPDEKGAPFWDLVTGFADRVAEDLDVELEVVNSSANRFASKLAIEKIANRDHKPDYIIFRPFQGNATKIFELLESQEIPFVTLEQAFKGNEALRLGLPGQKYQYWLGQINYDNVAGGELLRDALVRHSQNQKPGKIVFISGLGGNFDGVAEERQASLEKKFLHSDKIVVNQIFPMNWLASNVKDKFASIHQRYPNTTVYWCAGDEMAVEVIEQLKLFSIPASQKIMIGGFDWLPQALEKIKTGEMTASVGGHFLMAGNALLKIVDYHNGFQSFIDHSPSELFELIDTDNIDSYLPFIEKAAWKNIDFRQFSQSKHMGTQVKKLTVANLLQTYTSANHEIKNQ